MNEKSCCCGCGEIVAPKRLFRQGHDARYAGQLIKDFEAGRDIAGLAEQISPAFVLKVSRGISNVMQRHQAKIAKTNAIRRELQGKPVQEIEPDRCADVIEISSHGPVEQRATGKVGRWPREGKIVGDEFIWEDASGVQQRTPIASVRDLVRL